MTRLLHLFLLQPMRPTALLAALCFIAIGIRAFAEQYRQTTLFGDTGDIGAALDHSWQALVIIGVLAALTRALPFPMLIATYIFIAITGGEMAGEFITTNRPPLHDSTMTFVLLLLAGLFLTVGYLKRSKLRK